MKPLLAALSALVATVLGAQTVTLAWDPSPDAPMVGSYVVYFGEASRSYSFATNAGLSLTQTVALPYPADWYFAVTAVGTNTLESDYSNEVMWREPMGPPEVKGIPMVRLLPQLERSTNEVDWSAFPGTPTYVPATNALELFRNTGLMIERVKLVSSEQ